MLEKLGVDEIDLAVLKAANVVPATALQAKVIKSGELSRKLQLKGVLVTKGARAAVEAAGGSVTDIDTTPVADASSPASDASPAE